ncbi:MAG: hypothetical protein QXD23_02085 [Candidatus Micrarchaeaceae archaeon]
MRGPNKKVKNVKTEVEFAATVAEGMYRDKNLGVVPLTKKIQMKAGIVPGDIVEISFDKKKVVATVIEGYERDSESGYIRLDKNMRDELGIILGEQVNISKPKVYEAREVIVEPIGRIPHTIPIPVDWPAYFRQRLENKGVIEGSKITMPIFGLNIEFDVVRVLPEGVCKITPSTNFDFASKKQAC